VASMTASPLRVGASLEEELDYYKKQYEQLETDLADFQTSSKELEEQLERDIETAEKSERRLKEQVEKLSFEVEEWKTKHKQSKMEANSAQNALQREITTMRDSHRTLQLRLRDIEVVNDDYERQARNTESSLEDLESKHNVAVERGVILEEEIKNGEQEREALRIETQRLRDELGDLKVESEITLEKLRLADGTIERLRSRKPSPLAVENLRARSPGSEASGFTPSSPTASTPPPKSDHTSDAPTPPSPPLSDAPAHTKAEPKTPILPKPTSLGPDSAATPRPSLYGPRAAPRHSRGPSVASSTGTGTSDAKSMRPPATRPRRVSRPSTQQPAETLPRSDSLYQIKALRGRMQKIEERVQSARSKLPPSHTRTPTGSPRTGSVLSDHVPTSVTMRRSVKRGSVSVASSLHNESSDGTGGDRSRRDSRVHRLSYGIPRPPSSAAERPVPASGRPSSALGRPSSALGRPSSALDRPPSAAATSRPSSRASMATASAPNHRPGSRAEARTPLGHTTGTSSSTTSTTASRPNRPRSSVTDNYASAINRTPRGHRPSASVSEVAADATPSRRTTMEKQGLPSALPRRQSGGVQTASASRTSHHRIGEGEMRPPATMVRRKANDVGETY